MQTIIIATDSSETAQPMIEYGAALAKQLKADLLLYQSFALPEAVLASSVQGHNSAIAPTNNTAVLLNIGKKIQQQYQVKVEYHSSQLPLADELINLVSQRPAALVLMGRYTGPGWEHVLLGHNTAGVIRKAAFPVLIIPDHIFSTVPATLLFVCDYKSIPSSKNLEILQQIAKAFQAEVQVLWVVKKELSDGLHTKNNHSPKNYELTGINYRVVPTKASDILVGIEEGIQTLNPGLLIVAPHRYTFWEILLGKSIIRKLALQANLPMLLLPSE